MAKRRIICQICGKKFETDAPNTKYCSPECRDKGAHLRRKEWERTSGYLDRQREKMQLYRENMTIEEKASREVAEKREAENRKRREARNRKKRQAELEKAAEQGEPMARLEKAVRVGGNRTVEYWRAWRDLEIEYAAGLGAKSTSTVNLISVYDPDFALKVIITQEELGSTHVYTGIQK